MGVLTEPRGGQSWIVDFIVRRHSVICYTLYFGGIFLFLALAHESLNNETYFSENALLPGLVHNEFNDEANTAKIYEELLDEQIKYRGHLPHSWLLAKFRQFGLDTYTHNFSLEYPLIKGRLFYGNNIYGIVRAPRAASTEALVLSVPYRPPNSVHDSTTPSIALMLSFANFCKQQRYWAKDIIFLVTEHEQLGVQAWLEAYLGVTRGSSTSLNAGTLSGRAGAIQAAINLEFHDVKIGYIDVKIEGLNGQLPNLDLVNLAYRLAAKDGIRHTFKRRAENKIKDPFQHWLYSFKTLLSMVTSQATGVPTGNHGLYHRFGIEAITLEGYAREGKQSFVTFYTLGRLLESIFRSLNNLLERFHQSYFFYLLPSLSRFVSIGTYIGSLCAFAAALLVKAFALWLQIQERPETAQCDSNQRTPDSKATNDGDTERETAVRTKNAVMKSRKGMGDTAENMIVEQVATSKPVDLIQIGTTFLLSHAFGILVMNSPPYICAIGTFFELPSNESIYLGFAFLTIFTLPVPYIYRLRSYKNCVVMNIIALMELATALTAIGINNFSLGFLVGSVYVPCVLLVSPVRSWYKTKVVQPSVWFLLHPFFILTLIVTVYTYISFPEERYISILLRSFSAAQATLVYTIVDSIIYGNWLFIAVTTIFLPNWFCFCCLLYSDPEDNIAVDKEKRE